MFIGTTFIYNNYIGTVRVSFEQTVYEIAEDERTLRVCVGMETMEAFSSNFAVQITSTDKSAQGVLFIFSEVFHTLLTNSAGGVDFEVLSTEVTLTGNSTCLDVTVIDDSVVESTETFTLTLSSADQLISVMNGVTAISILDNDSKSLHCYSYTETFLIGCPL